MEISVETICSYYCFFLKTRNCLNKLNWRYSLRKKCPHSELFWSECGKMRTRITLYTNTFHAVDILKIEFPLIDFILSFCFYTPRKQKTRVMFSGEIKNHQWYATGWRPVFKVALGHQSSPFSSGKKTVIFPQSDFT